MGKKSNRNSILRFFASLRLTIACLLALMALVVAGTLAQVDQGIYLAQKTYFRSIFLYWELDGTSLRIPFFPGGMLVGMVLLINLMTAHFVRFRFSKKHIGILLIHSGLFLLVASEFFTAFLAIESQMPIHEGEISNYSEGREAVELVITDTSNKEYDEVISFPESLCSKKKVIEHPSLPFTLHVRRWLPNAHLTMRNPQEPKPPISATRGVGADVIATPAPLVTRDDEVNLATMFLELKGSGTSLGTWMLSSGMPAKQTITHKGITYDLKLRRKRYYLPFSIKLEKFTREIHPGTEMPSSFSSLVSLYDENGKYERQTLIYMNHPLRLDGKNFYQASFGDNETLSILQVVENPTWLFPYISCGAVTLGLLVQFSTGMIQRRKKNRKESK